MFGDDVRLFAATVARIRKDHFTGSWTYVDDVMFTIAEQTAMRAFIELALLFRTLDDQEDIEMSFSETVKLGVDRSRWPTIQIDHCRPSRQ
jgi:hypothetical protein